MMKSIGSQIGLPFLSQDEDARLQFRSGKNGIKRLALREAIPVHDVGYWSQYWMLFESSADVHSLISTGDVRAALHQCPRNISTLITTLSHHLFSMVPSASFPTAPSSSSIPLPTNLRRTLTSARGGSNLSSPNPTREVLNCLRVLGRVLPIVYEAETDNAKDQDYRDVDGDPGYGQGQDDDDDDGEGEERVDDRRLKEHFAWHVLWKRPLAPCRPDSGPGSDDQVGREGGSAAGESRDVSMSGGGSGDPLTRAADEAERNQRSAGASREGEEEDEVARLPSLTDKLFGVTVDLLFCAGFTIPESMKGPDGKGDKINYVIWEKGVGSTHDIGSTAEFDRNKIEVLRFLLVLLSSTIYTAPHSLPHSLNRPLQFLTHNLERRLVLSLLCSWLNTSLSRGSQTAWGENIPYNHLITRAGDDRRTLVRMSLMVLLVALDHWKVDREETVETPGFGGNGFAIGLPLPSPAGGQGNSMVGETVPKKDENAFRYFVSKLHRTEDFEFILNGVLAILAEHTAVNQNVLPGSKKPIDYILEIFMLFWKLMDLNKRFRAYVHESGKSNDIVGYILLTCLEMKDNPAHHGLLRMLSYILQAMSADREFGTALNKPLTITVPVKWNVQGSTADFMVVSMYSIATTPGLNPLFPALTVTISNVAPYLKGLGVQASTRLLQLFKAFSAPNFLLADEGHPRLVYYLLETFNGIIFNQLQENPNIVYAILRSHQDFQNLATFTLLGGLRDIQKRMLARAANQAAIDRKTDETRASQDSNVPQEKAGLLSEEHRRDTMDIGSPNLGTLAPARSHSVTSPLFTPGEAEEDPMATAESNASKQTANPKSEKAKGKMRERSESTSTLAFETELHRLAMSGIGPNGYVPTQEWVSSWQKGLPLDPVLLTISELLPKVQELQPSTTPGPSRNVISFLKSATLVDVLPPHPAHNPRRFQWSVASTIWLSSLLWGQIYTAALQNFNNTAVRLFGVKQAAPTRREQAIQNVSNRLMSFVNGYPAPMVTGIPNGRPSMSGM